MRVFIPRDTTAVALGADRVAAALQTEAAERNLEVELVRNGSRGMFSVEPLVEIDLDDRRMAFGPVAPVDVPGLIDALSSEPDAHPLYLGLAEAIPWLARQQRLTFARAGLGDPVSLDTYRSLGGFAGLDRALSMVPADIVREITDSGLVYREIAAGDG